MESYVFALIPVVLSLVLIGGITTVFAYWDLEKIDLEILDVKFNQQATGLLQIQYSLTSHEDIIIILKGKEVIDLRAIDYSKEEARTHATSFSETYEYATPDGLAVKYGEKIASECQKVDFNLKSNDSVKSTLCFDVSPHIEKYLKKDSTKEYYLVLSSRSENSCPFCKTIQLVMEDENESNVSYGSPTRLEIDDLEAEQISSTDLGNIDVLLAPSPSVPQPKAHNNLHIIFFQPDTRHLINHIDFKILISKDGNEVYSSSGPVHTHPGQDTVSYYFSTAGKYQVEVSVLGVDFVDVPVETALFSLVVGNVKDEQTAQTSQSSKMSYTTQQTKTFIPDWVKQVAEFWVADQIDDSGFVQVIEYLVQEEIITIPYAEAPEGETAIGIPIWIKTTAEFWVNGDVSDDEFATALEWLINNGIIRV